MIPVFVMEDISVSIGFVSAVTMFFTHVVFFSVEVSVEVEIF